MTARAILVFAALSLISNESRAVDFQAQREAASRFVARKQARAGAAHLGGEASGPTVASLLRLESSPLKPGNHWAVRAQLADAAMARKSAPAVITSAGPPRPGALYEFKVVGLQGEDALVDVTRDGEPLARLTLDPVRRLRDVKLSNAGAGFDLFPLSLPTFDDETARDEGTHVTFAGEDSLARKVTVDWTKGDPWPTTVSGPAGTATLVKEGAK